MVFKLAIDAGHGLYTPGKRAPDDSMREFHFNNPVAQMIGSIIKSSYENTEIYFVYDTSGKTDTGLNTRSARANQWGADAFVSIHANAFGSGGFNSTGGIETFYYSGPVHQKTVELAANVQNQLIRDLGRPNRGVKRQNFAVLRNTNMPAVLVECGFMTNREELALLKSQEYRAACAAAVAQGIAQTFGLKKKSGAPANTAGSPSTPKKEENDLYDPKNGEMLDATSRVLLRLANKPENAIPEAHRNKLLRGELTNSEAIGLLYVAIDRGLIQGTGSKEE